MATIENIPNHVAIIMDGNRRSGQRRFADKLRGHQEGAKTVEMVIRESVRLSIPYLTLYALSTENWGRSITELGSLMDLFRKFFSEKASTLVAEGVQVRFIGRREEGKLPPDILMLMKKIEKTIPETVKMTLTIALDYGGDDEIVRAVNELRKMPRGITMKDIDDHLDTYGSPAPDCIIRTGGEQRLSNFLVWQARYAELIFTETCWPDLTKEGYIGLLSDYQSRVRTYGGDRLMAAE